MNQPQLFKVIYISCQGKRYGTRVRACEKFSISRPFNGGRNQTSHLYDSILFAAVVFNKRQKISLHKVTKLSVSSLSLLLCYQIADTKLPVTNCQLTNFRFYLCTNCLYQIASYQVSVTKLLLKKNTPVFNRLFLTPKIY